MKRLYFNIRHYQEKGVRGYFFIGAKSIGKTFWGINYVIDDYIKTGKGFAWMFNTLEEVKDFKSEFRGHIDLNKFAIIGNEVWDIRDGLKNKKLFGKFGSLSTPHKFKNLECANKLIFDEFDTGTGKGLEKDIKAFFKILSNIGRLKKDFKFYCFSNAETTDNLFFNYFNIRPFGQFKNKNGIYYRKDKLFKFVIIDKNMFVRNAIENSLAYKFLNEDSTIKKQFVDNEYAGDNFNLVSETGEENILKPLYYINYLTEKYLVSKLWNGKTYIDYSFKYDYDLKEFSFSIYESLINNNRIDDNDDILISLKELVYNNNIVFFNLNIKNNILNLISTFINKGDLQNG